MGVSCVFLFYVVECSPNFWCVQTHCFCSVTAKLVGVFWSCTDIAMSGDQPDVTRSIVLIRLGLRLLHTMYPLFCRFLGVMVQV